MTVRCACFLVSTCVGTAEEKTAWTASLDAEETERLASLHAAMTAFDAKGTPILDRVNSLLVAAFQGQVTLMRASRVFPERCSGKCTSVTEAMAHDPTVALARRLHHCWRVLGVTRPTLKALLRQAVYVVGTDTWSARRRLFVGLQPDVRRGVDPKAHTAFVAEGSGECRMDV